MNELEKLLSRDLHDVAGSVDIPVSLDAIAAEHRDVARRAARTRWALTGLAVLAAVAVVWVVQSLFVQPPDRGVPNPLQSPSASAEPTPSSEATPTPEATSTPTPTPTPASSGATSRPVPGTAAPTASGGAGRTVATIVYFLVDDRDGPRLVREERQVAAATPARGALEAMIAGPLDPDYTSPLPPDTRVLGIAHRDGVITVDLSAEARRANVGASGEVALVQQIAWTLTQVLEPGASVRVLIEGEPASWGHVLWDQPVTPQPALDARFWIGIDTPAQGAEVSAPVEVRGEAAVFEATLLYSVTRADGTLVTEGVASTAEGQRFAPYRFTLDLPPGEYTLTVAETDPSGGASGFPPRTDSRTFTVR